MEKLKLQERLLLSSQRAMLGKIYPAIRAIAIGFSDEISLSIYCYLDREIIKYDYENLNDISAEIFADMNFSEVNEKCYYSLEPFSSLDNLDYWIYMRKET